MLKLYACVVCEKVIVAQDLIPSLIGLFGKILVSPPVGMPEIPPNAVSPKEWAVFSSWDAEPGDELKEYFVCTQVLYPDRKPFGDVNKTKINIELNKRSQIGLQMFGFPIGQIGFYTVRTWIEENQRVVFDPIEIKIELQIINQEQAQ